MMNAIPAEILEPTPLELAHFMLVRIQHGHTYTIKEWTDNMAIIKTAIKSESSIEKIILQSYKNENLWGACDHDKDEVIESIACNTATTAEYVKSVIENHFQKVAI